MHAISGCTVIVHTIQRSCLTEISLNNFSTQFKKLCQSLLIYLYGFWICKVNYTGYTFKTLNRVQHLNVVYTAIWKCQ